MHGAEGETENIGTNSLMGPQLLRPLHFFFRVKRNRLGKSNSLDDWVKRSRLGKQQLGGATSSYALFFWLHDLSQSTGRKKSMSALNEKTSDSGL